MRARCSRSGIGTEDRCGPVNKRIALKVHDRLAHPFSLTPHQYELASSARFVSPFELASGPTMLVALRTSIRADLEELHPIVVGGSA